MVSRVVLVNDLLLMEWLRKVLGRPRLKNARGSGTGQPPLFYFADDKEFRAASDLARSTLERFLNVLREPGAAQKHFKMQVRVDDGREVEYVWLGDISLHDGGFRGIAENKPNRLSNLKMGDDVRFETGQISDWMFVDNGRLIGGRTIRLLRKRMRRKEREEFDRSVPFVVDEADLHEGSVYAFFDAIGNFDSAVVKRMLEANPGLGSEPRQVAVMCSLGYMDFELLTPIKYAIYHGNCDAVRFLLDAGADVDSRSDCLNTPLHDAAMWGRDEIVDLLIRRGAEVDAQNTIGLTPLMAASRNDQMGALDLLLRAGAAVQLRESASKSVLHCATSGRVADALVESGAEVDAVDAHGRTPLLCAFWNRRLDLALALLRHGADSAKADSDGRTPMDFAREYLAEDELSKVLAVVEGS